jgi:potassium-transporting ATPase KdpC subunit
MATGRGTIRQVWVAIRILLVFTLVLGILYPLAVTLVGQVALPAQANGSLVRVDGTVVGSSLIGQGWTDKKGKPLPQWFQSRPSAAGAGYDGKSSGGSNQGTESATLIKAIKDRRAAIAKFNGVEPSAVPADALTASASGLDPQISPAYARIQVDRVAQARGLDRAVVAKLVESTIQVGDLGYLGEPTVNVLLLNIALAKLDG